MDVQVIDSSNPYIHSRRFHDTVTTSTYLLGTYLKVPYSFRTELVFF